MELIKEGTSPVRSGMHIGNYSPNNEYSIYKVIRIIKLKAV